MNITVTNNNDKNKFLARLIGDFGEHGEKAERKIPHQGASNRDQSDAGTEGTIKKMHKCNDCDFTTPWPSSLCRHRRIHDQNMFFCDQCDSRFPDLCMLKVHTKHKHGEGLICTHCSKKFTSLAGLNYHLKKISGQYRRKCTYCEKTFISIQHYESHVNKHKNIKPYKCDICQKAFLYKAHLTQHIEKGHSENNEPRTYKCEVCDIILTSKAAHRGHMIGKHSNNVRVCSTCGKSFNWAASYYRHIKSHDSDLTEDANSDTDKKKNTKQQSDGFKCNQCKKVFNRKSNLSRHKLIHLGKTQTCDCGKIFASPAAMKEHRKRHADPLIFTCWHADCGKVYSRRYSLQQHVRRDHGDHVPNISVFKCEVCDRDFSQKGHLREHMLRHTTDKQWMCQRCGKTMKYSRSLQRHVFRCKGLDTEQKKKVEEQYQCPQCDMIFNDRRYFKDHVKCVHGEASFQCSLCGEMFKWRSSLCRHVTRKACSKKEKNNIEEFSNPE